MIRTCDLLCVKQEVFIAKLRFWRLEAKCPISDLLSRFSADFLSWSGYSSSKGLVKPLMLKKYMP